MKSNFKERNSRNEFLGVKENYQPNEKYLVNSRTPLQDITNIYNSESKEIKIKHTSSNFSGKPIKKNKVDLFSTPSIDSNVKTKLKFIR